VEQEQLHVFPLAKINSFHQQISIMFTKDGIHTLIHVVIANPNICKFIFLILNNSKICCLQWSSNQRKELLQTTPHWSIPPFNNWDILDVCINKLMCSYAIVPMPFGVSKGQRALLFLSWLFFFVKNFNYITKDANILNLKLSDNDRFNHFLTSTPSWHTSTHLLWIVDCWDGEILIFSLCWIDIF
jgi:hypothetical protein